MKINGPCDWVTCKNVKFLIVEFNLEKCGGQLQMFQIRYTPTSWWGQVSSLIPSNCQEKNREKESDGERKRPFGVFVSLLYSVPVRVCVCDRGTENLEICPQSVWVLGIRRLESSVGSGVLIPLRSSGAFFSSRRRIVSARGRPAFTSNLSSSLYHRPEWKSWIVIVRRLGAHFALAVPRVC